MIFKTLFVFMCVCVMYLYIYVKEEVARDQKRALDALELKLKVVVISGWVQGFQL